MDKESVYELAPIIAAVHDVYYYMSTHDWADECEAEYLLKQENPLYHLAEIWKEETDSLNSHMGWKLTKAIARGEDSDYMASSTADDLRDKYGEAMPLNTAALLEIVELGRKYLTHYGVHEYDFDFDDDNFDGEDDL